MTQAIIGVVGPCAAGKSTLIKGLENFGISAKHIAQEHSYVADMWRRFSKPDILIFLDVSYLETIERRKMNWSVAEYQEQVRRLEHARQHADSYIMTDDLTPKQVLEYVKEYLSRLLQE